MASGSQSRMRHIIKLLSIRNAGYHVSILLRTSVISTEGLRCVLQKPAFIVQVSCAAARKSEQTYSTKTGCRKRLRVQSGRSKRLNVCRENAIPNENNASAAQPFFSLNGVCRL